MADLQARLDDLRTRLRHLQERALTGEDTARDVTDIERQARDLLSDAKNTPSESAAQNFFGEVARLNNPISPTAATVRGLARRARIRIEIAGDEDDIDEAIDILAEAIALNPQDEAVIGLLQTAAARTEQANRRVSDLFKRYNVTPPQSSESSTPPVQPSSRAEPPEEQASSPRYPTSAGYPPPEENLYPRRADPNRRNDPDTDDSPNPRSTQTRGTPRRVPGQGPLYSGSDIDEMISELTAAYYSGEYQRTVEVANRILSQQPGNPTALEYREKSEDNLIRGVVPDHRIPFDARVSYNRANSLVRAGNYEEAERLYREARDLAERNGILSWKDAEQALLDIQDLALARELLSDGDRLLATDNWSDALRKYEGALRVVANDPQAEERVEIVRRVQQDADQAALQLSTLSGTMQDQVGQLQNVLTILARVRQLLPTSQRLNGLQTEANNKLASIKTQLNDQAQNALMRAKDALSLEERLLYGSDALRLLELATALDPGDARLSELTLEARGNSSDMQRARQVIERAASLIAQNFDAEMSQARSMLSGLTNYAQDERYRSVVNDLLARYMERAEMALEDGDVAEAQSWLETMREDPFRILGRRPEIQRLENQIRRDKSKRWWQVLGVIFGVIVLVGVGILLTRNQWMAIIDPPATNTPTATFTPSITPTASSTPTPSATSTASATPTWTVTPSLTVTPSETPTETLTPTHTSTPTPTSTTTSTATVTPTPTATDVPPFLCVIINTGSSGRVNVRNAPNGDQIAFLGNDQTAEVYQQRRINGVVWYQVRYASGESSQIEGWIRSDTVGFVGDPCPDVPVP